MTDEITMSTSMVAVEAAVEESVRKILPIARATLSQQGTHLPTAILHTLEGLLPIVLPFEEDEQRRALVAYVKRQAVERHAFAVTMVTCARVVDSRTGDEEEALVLVTSVQGGCPCAVTQRFWRDDDHAVSRFGEVVEGDEAVTPGQMMILPDWDEEVRH
jgi:hypothetical protein